MPPTKEAKAALASSVNGWFKNFGGTSALDVARYLSLDHSLVMRLFEELAKAGHGSINADVTLYQVSFDPENIAAGFKHEPVVTHIFFPSKQALHDAFYSSDLPQQRLPEYTTRLHLGDRQIGLAYFTEEVLARYLDHPELYEINDSLVATYLLCRVRPKIDTCTCATESADLGMEVSRLRRSLRTYLTWGLPNSGIGTRSKSNRPT